MQISIAEILDRFPTYACIAVVARGCAIPALRPPALAEEIARAERSVVARIGDTALNDVPELKDWRAAYKGFGIRSTSYRSSVERLVRSCQKGRGLPHVNALVDAYNRASVDHLVPIGADDLSKVEGDICFRFSRDGDSFLALGKEPAEEDPPKPGEVVYADAAKVLCRRWNWYQDARSPVTTDSRDVVLTVQGLGAGDVDRAAADLMQSLARWCGADCASARVDARQPTAEIA